jgi:hypothetical protein
MTVAANTAAEIAWEKSPAGTGRSVGDVLAGNLVGNAAGAAVGAGLGVAFRRVMARYSPGARHPVREAWQMRRSREWMHDPNTAVGDQRFVTQAQGLQLLRLAATDNLAWEFGVVSIEHQGRRRLVLRRGTPDNVPFNPYTEIHIAHYHPAVNRELSLRYRLPAPNDVNLAVGDIIARRHPGQSATVATGFHTGAGIHLTPDHINDFSGPTGFVDFLHLSGFGERRGNELFFRSLEDYNQAFFQYHRAAFGQPLPWNVVPVPWPALNP